MYYNRVITNITVILFAYYNMFVTISEISCVPFKFFFDFIISGFYLMTHQGYSEFFLIQ